MFAVLLCLFEEDISREGEGRVGLDFMHILVWLGFGLAGWVGRLVGWLFHGDKYLDRYRIPTSGHYILIYTGDKNVFTYPFLLRGLFLQSRC